MDYLFEAGIGAVTCLAGMNAYFVRGLVKKIEISSEAVRDMQTEMKHINSKLDHFESMQIRLIDVEKKLAVLEYRAEKE